jgi:hypothetical protein
MFVGAPLSIMLVLASATPPGGPGPAPGPGRWLGMVATSLASGTNRCIPDVNHAFSALEPRGVLRGFDYSEAPSLDGLFRHFQGITRLGREDGTWLAVSRSGSPNAVALIGPSGIVAEIEAPPGLTHAGGIQALGSILAVPYEHKQGQSRVMLYDVADPTRPRILYELDRSDVPAPSAPGHASAVALARLADGRLLMIVGVRSSKVLDIYVSNQADLSAPGLAFVRVGTLEDAIDGKFQSQNLVTQCDGALFLVGAYNSGFPAPRMGADRVRWYRLDSAWDGGVMLTEAGNRKVKCRRCNFGAAAGVFVTGEGQLVLYAIEHGSGSSRTITYEEFRARSSQPTVPTGG